jgi:predicted exporter
VSRSSRWAVWIWLAFLFTCVALISRTQFSTDLSAFLPRSPSPAQQIFAEQLRDGVVSRLILIGIEGSAPAELAQVSKRLVAQLRRKESFVAADNGEDVGSEKDRKFLWRNRYLLSPTVTPERFSSAALRAALNDSLQLLGSPVALLLQRILPSDPTGELMRLVEQFEERAKPATRHGVWFSANGERALLVAQTKAAGYDLDAQERTLAEIGAAFGDAAGASGSRLLLSGPGVFAVSTRERIRHDALRLSLIATTLVAAMLFVLYRSARVLGLSLLPVASGALAGVAAVSLGFGSVHGITLGFGITLIGEAVDYAIYLFTQIAPGTSPRTTLDRIWPTLRLGVLTSICGFSAMLLSGFPGLAQLGLLSTVGLIVAVTVTRCVLPALLPSGFAVTSVEGLAPRLMAAAQRAPALRLPLVILVALAGAMLLARHESLWSDDLASLSPISAEDQSLDQQLRRNLGAPDVRHLIVVRATDQETALQASENIAATLRQLSEERLLEGFDSPATYLPSQRTQRAHQAALPPPEVLRDNLQKALHGLPFRPHVFEPFLSDAAAAKEQRLLTRADLQGTRLALKLDSVLVERNDGWAAMLPLRGVADPEGVARRLRPQLSNAQAVFLDLKRESDDLYRGYRSQAIRFSLLGAGAIVILLFVSLRSVRRVWDVLAPLAAAVVVTSGMLVLGDTRLSIFHLVGLLLVVAVGSNYSLFFDQQAASGRDRTRTIVSLLFANVTTAIGFGLLAFSKVPVLHGIGSTVAIGAVLSLVFSAILIKREDH